MHLTPVLDKSSSPLMTVLCGISRFCKTSWYRAMFPFLSGWLWAKYPAAGVQHLIQKLMGTALKLSNLHTSVVIPSYELESSSPFTFWHHQKEVPQHSLTGYIAMLRAHQVPQQVCFRPMGHPSACCGEALLRIFKLHLVWYLIMPGVTSTS